MMGLHLEKKGLMGKCVTSLASLALVASMAVITGCSRISVTRTVNADGTVIDEYRCQFNEKGLSANGEQMTSGDALTRQIQQLLSQTRTDKDVVGQPMMGYKGELTFTALADHAAKSGVLYEAENWLTAQKASWVKQADGGWAYELPINPETLEKAFALSGLVPPAMPNRQNPDDAAPGQDDDDEGAPPPLFPVAPPPVKPGSQVRGAGEQAHLEAAWKALEVEVEIVMPGKITSTNGKAGKDRSATWVIKPYELMQDAKAAATPKAKEAKIMVLKATCGPALAAAKADEDRYKKLKGASKPAMIQE